MNDSKQIAPLSIAGEASRRSAAERTARCGADEPRTEMNIS